MRCILVMLCLLGGTAAAAAQSMMQGVIAVGGKPVPLPPGSWRLLHQTADRGFTAGSESMNTTTHRAVLVQEHGGRAAAVIVVQSASELGVFWRPFGVCVNANAVQRTIVQAVERALDCRGIVVVGSGRGPNTPAYLNALYDEGERRPGWIPPRWLSAQIVLSEGPQMLTVEYRFAPQLFGAAVANLVNWNEGARVAAQNEVVQRLATFSTQANAELRRGLHGRQPERALPSPF